MKVKHYFEKDDALPFIKGCCDGESIELYYPNIRNSVELFLIYYHEIIHYISMRCPRIFERFTWVFLDYVAWRKAWSKRK